MNIKTVLMSAIGAMLLCAGCGEGLKQTDGEKMDAKYRSKMYQEIDDGLVSRDALGAGVTITYNIEDELYYQCYRKSFKYPHEYMSKTSTLCPHAWAKRREALEMSREVFCYTFKNYFFLDGVSGLIYNVSYIMQAPHKALRGLRAMDGIWRYIKAMVKLLIGVLFAFVGLVLSPIFNTLCHPFETIANLSVGIYSGNFLWTSDAGFDMSWFTYVWRTNLIASLWDLIWGGIIYPLWQALIFWL